MSILGTYRLLNALENGITPADLNTFLANQKAKNELFALMQNSSMLNRISYQDSEVLPRLFKSSVAVDTLLNPPNIRELVYGNNLLGTALFSIQEGVNAVLDNATHKNNAFASTAAMNLIGASQLARLKIYNTDSLLTDIFNNTTVRDILRASSSYVVSETASTTGTNSRAIAGTTSGGLYVVLGYSTGDSHTGQTITISTLRTGSSRPTALPTNVANAANSTLALATVATPIRTPFTAVSTSTSTQRFYFGLLRCDV